MNLGTLDFTIGGWVKTDSTKVRNTVVEFEFHNPALYVSGPNGVLRFNELESPIGGFNDGVFHHFAVARNNGVLSFYKDGALIGTNNYTGNINQGRFYIGFNTLLNDAFPGAIDDGGFLQSRAFQQRNRGDCHGRNRRHVQAAFAVAAILYRGGRF